MNVVGRQMSRSNSSSQHERQYSDHLIDASSKWLQSSATLSQVLTFVFKLMINSWCFVKKRSRFIMCRILGSMEEEIRVWEWVGALWTLRRLRVQGRRAWERTATIKSRPVSSAPACLICIASILSFYLRFALTFHFCIKFHVRYIFFEKCMYVIRDWLVLLVVFSRIGWFHGLFVIALDHIWIWKVVWDMVPIMIGGHQLL